MMKFCWDEGKVIWKEVKNIKVKIGVEQVTKLCDL